MTDAATDTPAASLNGTGPDVAQPCEDCATSGEKALAVVAALFGVFIILVAVDMFLGGRLGGYVKDRVPQ